MYTYRRVLEVQCIDTAAGMTILLDFRKLRILHDICDVMYLKQKLYISMLYMYISRTRHYEDVFQCCITETKLSLRQRMYIV